MRHSLRTAVTAAAFAGITLLAACSGHNRQSAAAGSDSDSAFIAAAEAAADSLSVPALTPAGIGAVRIGMPLDSLPDGIPALYDRIGSDETPDAMVYNFYMGETPMFDVYTFGDGKVDMIALTSPVIGVRTPGGLIHVGDPMKSLLALDGVSTEFASMDDSGLWYWKYDSLWFSPDPEQCSPALIEALGNRRTPPSAALIPDGLSIGFIATGLPY